MVAFNPLLRTIQFPWYTSLSLKTKKPNSPVISVNIGQNTTARVYVSSLRYIINEYFNLQMSCIFSWKVVLLSMWLMAKKLYSAVCKSMMVIGIIWK